MYPFFHGLCMSDALDTPAVVKYSLVYDIHASKDNVYSDDVTLKTPLLHSAEEALDYIEVLLNSASAQKESGGDNSVG